MARDGSGTYTRVEGPYVNGNVADADEINNELDDISDALTNSINTAGTKAFGADQSMGGFKLTDLAAPSGNNDAARKKYVDDAITAAAQPVDATLTALAALSWSSGNALVQFTAADTVSLTLTPSVSSITASQGAAATTPSAAFTNTTDSAAVRIARFDGDRATPAANDQGYVSFYMSDSAGTQKEFIRLTVLAAGVTAGAEDARWLIGTLSGGSITTRLHLSSTEIRPGSNDGYALGASGVAFSDLFLASGGVINWNNGNFTLTHSSGLLSANGAIQARVPLSSETSGTLSSASANKKCLLTGNITLNDGVFTAHDFVLLDPGTSARTVTRDTGATMYVNGTNSASATLAANQMGTAHWRTDAIAVLSGALS